MTIRLASFTAASPTLFTLFLTLDLLNLLEEDLPPTGPLSSDDAVNALQLASLCLTLFLAFNRLKLSERGLAAHMFAKQ